MSVWNRQTWRWLACLSISTTYVYYRKSKAATNLGRRPFQYAIIKIPLKLAKLNYFFKFKKKNYILIVVMGGSWTLKQTEKRLMNYTWNFIQTLITKLTNEAFCDYFSLPKAETRITEYSKMSGRGGGVAFLDIINCRTIARISNMPMMMMLMMITTTTTTMMMMSSVY